MRTTPRAVRAGGPRRPGRFHAETCRGSRLRLAASLALAAAATGALVAGAAGPGRAAVIEDVGMNGLPGTGGPDGDPGFPGTDGGNGEDATAVADEPDPPLAQNQATATGGAGGSGGPGGDGVDDAIVPDPGADANGGPGGAGGDGGGATATANTVSNAPDGPTSATATATGGRGGNGGAGGTPAGSGSPGQPGPGGDGGDAVARADTNPTQVFAAGTSVATARGGDGGTPPGGPATLFGDGGDATATADVNARSAGAQAKAFGGDGRAGGDASASSDVFGRFAGPQFVAAYGGRGFAGPGGDATAVVEVGAIASTVESAALAVGGPASLGQPSGAALARATSAPNIGGSARAEARSAVTRGDGLVVFADADTSLTVAGATGTAEARAAGIQPLPARPTGGTDLEGFTYAAGVPLSSDVAAVTAGDPTVQADFAGEQVAGYALLGGTFFQGTPTQEVGPVRSDATFEIPAEQLTGDDLLVGLLDPEYFGTAGVGLHFQVLKEGVVVVDQAFADPAAATDYFDDNPLNLGPAGAGVTDGLLTLTFRLDSSPALGAGFATDLIFGGTFVPEPGAAALIACLGGGLLARRRRGSTR